MQYGLILPNFAARLPPADLVPLAQRAEALGFDSVWTTDHILLPQQDAQRFGWILEAIITLAFLAGHTRKLRLGVSCLVLPIRQPALVAKQVATLDVLSGGRTILCACVGWSAGEYANLGIPFHERGRRMGEALHLLRALWRAEAGHALDFQGHYYPVRQGVFEPPPQQAGGPPLLIGGQSQAAMRRAVELADGWHLSSLPLDSFRPLAARFRRACGEAERTLSLRARLSYRGGDPDAPLQGPDARLVDTLHAYREAGLEYLIIDFPGTDLASLTRAMERFAARVLPLAERQ